MELAIDDPIKRAKEYAINPNQFQAPTAPLSQDPSMASQMGTLVKQKLMSDAAGAGAKAITTGATSAMGSAGMAGMATAMPYIGAGLLAGKAFGLFNKGGQVGPLSPQYMGGLFTKELQKSLNRLYDEAMAENMTEAAQQATPTPMPVMRPPLRIDPYGADTTSSPYDMIRSDNAPNT